MGLMLLKNFQNHSPTKGLLIRCFVASLSFDMSEICFAHLELNFEVSNFSYFLFLHDFKTTRI